MNISFDPKGTGRPIPEQRTYVWKCFAGDTISMSTRIHLSDSSKVNLDNSELTFTLRDQRFSPTALWEGTWGEGIELVDPINHPGLVKIQLPDELSAQLRRGSYIFSILLEEKETGVHKTIMEGMLFIEYAPTSPNRDIPYRPIEQSDEDEDSETL